ncbi:Transposase [Cohaesibacter marisflavi]|uniref:Transposase n=1 Tax=Cohaesibacter marisflavi TaxID=655353 RepID=A0A1I5M1U5_9HYPH|nr:transposase [Cohaesibacter marisflavi]SFP03522.1 Transposase [Cohaesibacter marisflavi]
MMGHREKQQAELFYEFSLEGHVPQDHLLRSIDRFVDLTSVRDHLKPFYSHTGRPSVDPELMIRMLLVGYINGIRSERRLCEEVHLNLAYRWFCRLDLTDPVPDHSTFSKNRHGRFRESNLLRMVFEAVVARCIEEGVVGGEHFASDASLIEADANKQNSTAKEDWDPDKINPEIASRAVKDYLFSLDDEAFGAATDVVPKFTSHSDPSSQWTAARHGPAFFAYSNNYLIDTDHAIIVDVQASRSVRTGETYATRTMIERAHERFGLWPERLIADTAYGSAEMLAWLVYDWGIEPHIPVIDKSKRDDGTFSREDFAYERETDSYVCPAGKQLLRNRRKFQTIRADQSDLDFVKYGAAKADCEACALRQQCCPKGAPRRLLRSKYEGARQMARDIAKTEDYAISCKLRKKVEMLFAHLKRILGLRRLRLRGPNGANDEFLIAATAQNLRKLAKLFPGGPKPQTA